jgi:hypothetical protein
MECPAVLLPQGLKLARGAKDRERAQAAKSSSAIAVIDIDIGQNALGQRLRATSDLSFRSRA